jgi:predicted MFS family arabinose efflux permease
VSAERPLFTARYVQRVIALLTLAVFVEFFHRQILAVAINAIGADLALSDTQLGWLVMAFALAYFLGGIVLGRSADRLPRRTIYAAGMAFWSVATAAGAAVGHFAPFVATRFAVGFGQSAAGATNSPLLVDYVAPERRSSALGILTMGATLGALSAGVLGAVGALSAFGWRGLFLGAGALGLVFATIFARAVAEPPRGWSEGRAHTPTQSVPLGEALRIARSAALLHIFAGAVVSSIAIFATAQWAIAFFERVHGLRNDQASLAFVGAALAGTVGALVGGGVANRAWLEHKRWVLLGPALCSVLAFPAMGIAARVQSTGLAIALWALGSALSLVQSAPAGAAMQALVPDRVRGFLSGSIAGILTLIGMGGGPLITGFLSDLLGAGRDPTSLGRALAWMSAFYLWAGAHLAWAARSFEKDLARDS